ncbi:MAG: hypothetical protein EON59_07695 [Alphaproteobacteria bacterium]|nr:MAG: hypothetical protein EON59_07695 [Alphaproteobacteria bacterium]
MIGLNVEDSQLVHIRNKETAQDVWISLRSAHEKDTLTNRVSLYKRIAMLKMKEDGKAEEHLNDLMNLFQKLEDLGQEGEPCGFAGASIGQGSDSPGSPADRELRDQRRDAAGAGRELREAGLARPGHPGLESNASSIATPPISLLKQAQTVRPPRACATIQSAAPIRACSA